MADPQRREVSASGVGDASLQLPDRPPRFIIAIDNSEQEPYAWPNVQTQPANLKEHGADYSVVGLESVVGIERKSHADFVGCLTTGRDRFENSLHRLAALRYPLVVIECDMSSLLRPFTYVGPGGVTKRSKLPPQVAQVSLLSWQSRFRIPFLLCGDRRGGAKLALQHLDLVWRMSRDGLVGDHAGVELV